MLICHKGSFSVQDSKDKIETGNSVVFTPNNNTDELVKLNIHKDDTRIVMLAGKPLNEPIAAQGPFVLNEKEELYKAFEDYQNGKNGFEGSQTWKSDIRNLPFKNKTR